jgi:hypothetical protein
VYRLIAAIAVVSLLSACNRSKDKSVSITPHGVQVDSDAMPGDPFGSASAAYLRLKEVTDAAVGRPWSGSLEDFAPWLEAQTVAIERSLGLLKPLRVGPPDVYAVANGRVAFVYEGIAMALTEASALAAAEGFEADWKDQEDRIWEQAQAFWARCLRGCSVGGSHLDAWDLRCAHGLGNSSAKLEALPPPRQAK